jgi:hypothetical protein
MEEESVIIQYLWYQVVLVPYLVRVCVTVPGTYCSDARQTEALVHTDRPYQQDKPKT